MVTTGPDQQRLERLAASLLERDDVDWGRMFGSIGLRVRDKVFAVALPRGGMMVKVPAERADELEAAGRAERMIMAGRPRREWVVLPSGASDDDWTALLALAHGYVDAITPPIAKD